MSVFSCRTASGAALAVVIGAAAAPSNAGNLVFNGGFETGTFAGWSVPAYVPMESEFRIEGGGGGGGHTGTYYAQLSSRSLQFMSQILSTEAGQDYELSFWMRTPLNAPAPFVIRWEGAEVFNQFVFLPDSINWHPFTIPLHSNITGSFLEFGQNVFPGEFQIDDISVVPIPAPSAAPLLLLGGVAALRRRRRAS